MKLVLVAGLNPKLSKKGPNVLLDAGWWKLCVENRIDSELVLHIAPYGRVLTEGELGEGGKFNIYEGESVSVCILNGSEDYINVFAELTNAPDLATASR